MRRAILKKMALYAAASCALALACTLLSYPGILYSDSYGRWDIAKYIWSATYPLSLESWVNVTPSFFMALVYAVTRNIAFFTLAQAVLFFFSSFLMIDRFVRRRKAAVMVLFAACPVFYGYSVFCEMSVGCVIGINFGLLLLLNENLQNYRAWKMPVKLLYYIALFFSFYLAFGFRYNAFTVLPIVFAIAFYLCRKHRDKLRFVFQAASVTAALALAALLPQLLGVTVYNAASAGFVWEMLSVIQKMPVEKQARYGTYLDFIAGAGSTERALSLNDSRVSVDSWLWDAFGVENIGSDAVQPEIMNKYRGLVFNETGAYVETKLDFVGRALGVQAALRTGNYSNDAPMQQHLGTTVNSPARNIFIRSYTLFQDVTVIFRIPWLWFAAGLAAVIWQLKRGGKKHAMESLALYLTAVFYYGAFLINNQSFEFRYFFPSLCMLFILLASHAAEFVRFRKTA